MKRFFILSALMTVILFGCCYVEDTQGNEKNEEKKTVNYKVVFDANGGDGNMPEQIFTAGISQTLNINTFKCTGHTFADWNTEPDGTGVTYVSGNSYSFTGDITLYAQWDVNNYTMKFNANGGNGNMPEQIFTADTSQILNANTFTRTGYTFAGWNTEPDGAGFTYISENSYSLTGNITLYAQWDVNTYTVIFYDNGGDGNMEHQSLTYNTEQTLPANTFTRKGYAFAGWALSDDGNAIYADKGKVKNLAAENNAIVPLYAVWTENNKVLPVIFSQPTTVDYGDSITMSCATMDAKINYTIDGVTAEYTDEITITKDVIITAFATKDGMKDGDTSIASYTVKTYRVTYRSKYGIEPEQITGLKKDDALTAEQLPELTADGYTFAGWYDGENEVTTEYKITGDSEFSAKWDPNTDTAYKVEHYKQNIADDEYTLAEADTENKIGTTDEDTSATAKDYTGFTAKRIEQMKIAADGSTVVKIYYDRNMITLKFNTENGQTEKIMGRYGATLENPTNPTKTGYIFAKWNPELPATFPVENTTYTATWTADTYKITYNLDGGKNAASNPANYTVETGTITLAKATKANCTFGGWYDENGNEVIQIQSNTAKNISVTAKWAPEGFVYVKGAIIIGGITSGGYTTSNVFTGGSVAVGNFYMSDHEVTQGEYETYCSYRAGKSPTDASGKGSNYPAYNVNFYEALVYCNKRSLDEQLTPCYQIQKGSETWTTNPDEWGAVPTAYESEKRVEWDTVKCDFTANGYRLPTRAEWEYAARGGKGLSGYQYKYAGSNDIGEVAWNSDNSGGKPHEVKTKKPNGLGLYDMSGNVSEICWDLVYYHTYDWEREIAIEFIPIRWVANAGYNNGEEYNKLSYGERPLAYGGYGDQGFRVVRTAE